MIEDITIGYLNNALSNGTKAFAEIPDNPASKYVVVQKTGGRRINHLDSSTLAIQSYAPTRVEAAELNDEVKGLMLDDDKLLTHPKISSVKLNSDYDFTNSAKKQIRYQAIYNITHY